MKHILALGALIALTGCGGRDFVDSDAIGRGNQLCEANGGLMRIAQSKIYLKDRGALRSFEVHCVNGAQFTWSDKL